MLSITILNMLSPKTADKHVEKLLRKINAEYEPEMVEIHSEPFAKKFNCFLNVEEKVKRDGGQVRYGMT
jgi:hypothetical protein